MLFNMTEKHWFVLADGKYVRFTSLSYYHIELDWEGAFGREG